MFAEPMTFDEARMLQAVRLGLPPDVSWKVIKQHDNHEYRCRLAAQRAFNGKDVSRLLSTVEILYWVNEHPIDMYKEKHRLHNATLPEIIRHMKAGLGLTI